MASKAPKLGEAWSRPFHSPPIWPLVSRTRREATPAAPAPPSVVLLDRKCPHRSGGQRLGLPPPRSMCKGQCVRPGSPLVSTLAVSLGPFPVPLPLLPSFLPHCLGTAPPSPRAWLPRCLPSPLLSQSPLLTWSCSLASCALPSQGPCPLPTWLSLGLQGQLFALEKPGFCGSLPHPRSDHGRGQQG